MDERWEDATDYPEDAMNHLASYYIYRNPAGYTRKKIDDLLGNGRTSDGRKWTKKIVALTQEYIEAKISESVNEDIDKVNDALELGRAEAEARGLIIPPQFALRAVKNQYGSISVRIIDPKSKRFIKLEDTSPEAHPTYDLPAEDLERKK